MWILSIFFTRRPPFKAGARVSRPLIWRSGVSVLLVWGKIPRVDLSLCVWLLGQRGKCIEKDVLVSVCYLYQLFLFMFVCTASTSRSCQSHSDHRRALCTFAPDFILIIIILTWITMTHASLRLYCLPSALMCRLNLCTNEQSCENEENVHIGAGWTRAIVSA